MGELTNFDAGSASAIEPETGGSPKDCDVTVAFSLLALDPSLRGMCLWGERSPIVDEFVGRLAVSRRTARAESPSAGIVRVPVYATPSDVLWPLPATAPLLPGVSMSLLERARGGVLLLENADLLSETTAAALMRSLNLMSRQERPLVIARSRVHPTHWPLISSECAFWLEEPGHPENLVRRIGPRAEARFPIMWAAPDDEVSAPHRLSQQSGQWPGQPPGPVLEQLVATIPPALDNAHGVDFFVARTASALAALDDAAEIKSHHLRRALRLVVDHRLPAEQSARSSANPRPGQPDASDAGDTAGEGVQSREKGPDAITDDTSFPTETESASGEGSGRHDAPGDDARTQGDNPKPAAPGTRVQEVVVAPAELFSALSLDIGEAHNLTPAGTWPARRGRNAPANRPGPPIGGAIRHRRGQTPAIAATLHAALPWQKLRRRAPGASVHRADRADMGAKAVHIRPEDLRSRRRRPKPKALYILAVDGSGSMARGRMHLAKGAALAVLAGAYRERRYVSLIDFRGTKATLLCPPGRSSTTIRRLLYDLPAGGGTPLPAALALARDVARRWLRDNDDGRVRLVLFTDGKANVPLTGDGNGPAPHTAATRRAAVREDIRNIGRNLHALGVDIRIVDEESWRPSPELHELASELGASVVRIDRRRFAG